MLPPSARRRPPESQGRVPTVTCFGPGALSRARTRLPSRALCGSGRRVTSAVPLAAGRWPRPHALALPRPHRENDITPVLDHTFCVEHNAFGRILQHELKPNGRNVPVTEENKKEYVRYCCGRPGLGEGGAEMAEARGPSPCDQPGSSRRASRKPLGPTGRAPSGGAPASPSPGGRAVTGRSPPQHCGEVSRDRHLPGVREPPRGEEEAWKVPRDQPRGGLRSVFPPLKARKCPVTSLGGLRARACLRPGRPTPAGVRVPPRPVRYFFRLRGHGTCNRSA